MPRSVQNRMEPSTLKGLNEDDATGCNGGGRNFINFLVFSMLLLRAVLSLIKAVYSYYSILLVMVLGGSRCIICGH